MNARFPSLLGAALTALTATMLLGAGVAAARDAQRPRGANGPRATQPHTRATERQRTESGRTRQDTWTGREGRTATRDAVVTNDRETGTRTRNVDYTGPNGNTAGVDSVRTRTDDGFTRATTVTNAQGETATRDLTVSRDKDAGTVSREANYTTFDGRTGSRTDELQRTDDGYARESTRTTPEGVTATRSVDVSCDKESKSCVKQVEVSREP